MARLEEAAAAARLGEEEVRELLATALPDLAYTARKLVARWRVDERSGGLTCRWVTTLPPAAGTEPLPQSA